MAAEPLNRGSGPGAQAADGCSVELWKRLAVGFEPDVIAAAVPAGAHLLELGCGPGRITHKLLRMGHRVTAIDNSPDMLAEISDAETVLDDIETLDLHRRFDAVLLCSGLIHVPDAGIRLGFLRTIARHLAPAGIAVIEWNGPGRTWPETPGPIRDTGSIRDVIESVRHEGRLAHVTLRHETADGIWTHSFVQQKLEQADFEAALAAAGLIFERPLTTNQSWSAARLA